LNLIEISVLVTANLEHSENFAVNKFYLFSIVICACCNAGKV